MRRAAIIALVVAIAFSALAAGSAEARSSFFRAKPSGITCGALRLGRSSATVRCDLPFIRRAAFLHTRGKGEIKRASSFLHPRRRPALRNGSVIRLGPFSCASRPSGVTCRTTGGHGFTVGRGFQLVF